MLHQFIETIKLSDGRVFHLEYHQERVCNTFLRFFPNQKVLLLSDIIEKITLPTQGKHKIRIVYGSERPSVEVLPYQIKPITTIKCVEADFLDYSYKFLDRTFLNTLKESAGTDEVIFVKNDKVTDSSYANIIFFDGRQWLTPSTFLLNGTCRRRLLKEGKIKEAPIHYTDIHYFEQIGFINAMLDIGELSLPISQLVN
ncbi:aminotransferase class IV [Capnocytophaga leadbetteri]|uniref:aminotransferase class IV n=1 Tax=Capnocytophaga leadbetteri TaxID=327575 RepID=UPI0026E93A6B|nr:aminotransferase class IV [Capnocytophaga leadbetteri]